MDWTAASGVAPQTYFGTTQDTDTRVQRGMPVALGVSVNDAMRKPRGGNYRNGEFYASRLSIRRRPRSWFAQAFEIVDRDARCADVYNRIPRPSLPAPFEQFNNRSFTCPWPRKYGGSGAIEGYWNVFMCEPCLTPHRDPDVRIPWSKAAGLEKGRVAADEAIRTAASLPVVRQAVASLEQLLQKAQRDFRLAQGPDKAETIRLQEDLAVARGRLAALDPNATRPATVSPQPPALTNAATAAAPPRRLLLPPPRRRAAATGERHEAAGRGHHEGPSRPAARLHIEARGCSTWKASLPAQEELLYAPLANLGCVVDVFISTDPSPRFAEMLRDYEAFANATNGSTTIAEVAAKHRKHQDSPQKPKVLAALDAVAAAGRAYDAIMVWRFDVQPLDAITTWPVRAGAVSVPFREAALREFPTRGRPRPPAATAFCNRIGTNDGRISDAAWVLDGSRVRDAYDAVAKASGRLLHYAFKDGPKERGALGEGRAASRSWPRDFMIRVRRTRSSGSVVPRSRAARRPTRTRAGTTASRSGPPHGARP